MWVSFQCRRADDAKVDRECSAVVFRTVPCSAGGLHLLIDCLITSYMVCICIYIYNNNLQKTNIILTYCILHSATVVPVNRLILLLKWKKIIHVNAWINKVITKVSALNGMETIKESRARSAPARTRSCSPPATPSQRRNRCFDHDLIINHPVFLFPLLIID